MKAVILGYVAPVALVRRAEPSAWVLNRAWNSCFSATFSSTIEGHGLAGERKHNFFYKIIFLDDCLGLQ